VRREPLVTGTSPPGGNGGPRAVAPARRGTNRSGGLQLALRLARRARRRGAGSHHGGGPRFALRTRSGPAESCASCAPPGRGALNSCRRVAYSLGAAHRRFQSLISSRISASSAGGVWPYPRWRSSCAPPARVDAALRVALPPGVVPLRSRESLVPSTTDGRVPRWLQAGRRWPRQGARTPHAGTAARFSARDSPTRFDVLAER